MPGKKNLFDPGERVLLPTTSEPMKHQNTEEHRLNQEKEENATVGQQWAVLAVVEVVEVMGSP